MKEKITKIIYDALDEIKSNDSDMPAIEKSPDTALYGRNSKLDSLGLVNLIVAVERDLEDEFEVEITLANEKAMAQKESPFRTVESFVVYIEMMLKETEDE
jgi:D-alanine--poly(phosphoribitol) ligase subunit 2